MTVRGKRVSLRRTDTTCGSSSESATRAPGMTIGFKLGQWVSNQRACGLRGERSAERVRRLESVRGPTWRIHEAAWEERPFTLNSSSREGHARVPVQWREMSFG